MNVAVADNLGLRARLGKKRRGFACALSAPDHRDVFAAKNSKIIVFAAMRH